MFTLECSNFAVGHNRPEINFGSDKNVFIVATTSEDGEVESDAQRRQKELVAEQQSSLSAKISECMDKVNPCFCLLFICHLCIYLFICNTEMAGEGDSQQTFCSKNVFAEILRNVLLVIVNICACAHLCMYETTT